MKRVFSLLLICVLGSTIVACDNRSTLQPSPTALSTQLPVSLSTSPASDLIITFERTICFGSCPAYKLTIQGDGTLIYEGKAYVAVMGVQTSQLGPDELEQLVAAFEEAGFFDMDDSYFVPVTDIPKSTTAITLNGRTKTVRHRGICGNPDLSNAPDALCVLQEKIDSITNSAQWTGR